MRTRHLPRLERSPALGTPEYVPKPSDHARCFLDRFFSDEHGKNVCNYNKFKNYSRIIRDACYNSFQTFYPAGRCEKIPVVRGATGMEMKHLPPFLTHHEVYAHYLRSPPEPTFGRHVSVQTFNRVWAKYFPNVVTPKTKRFSQCDICSQLKEFQGRNVEVEVLEYKTIEEQTAHRKKYSDRAKYIADLRSNHFRRVSIHQRVRFRKFEF